ncbi:ABC transporter permease [Terasakiella pusilla]|uniref:ABC transporter permease n=1 Tax=Terasakiella pusilla TaxID=64973 RepID=UPI003AA83CD0
MKLQPYATFGQKVWFYTFLGIAGGGLLFLVLPILVIMPLSFNGSSFLSYPLDGFSLRWYAEVFQSEVWVRAIKNSLIIGSASAFLATVLGTMAAMGLTQANFRGKGAVNALLVSPMIVPIVISALGLYFFFAEIGLNATYTGLILAHTALGAPFVVITVTATLQGFDNTLMRAASSLGANPVKVFFAVVLPLILPGVVSGALFAFATSFDEVVVVLFSAGPEQRTLPRQMFDGIKENITPAIMAAATLLIAFALALLSVLEYLRRRSEKLNSPS